MACIYKITNLVNNKFYIGSTYKALSKQSEEQKESNRKRVQEFADNHTGLHSLEAKEKRTNTLKIVFNTPEMKEQLKATARNRNRRLFSAFKNNILIGEFTNQKEAGEQLNINSSGIGAVLRNEQKMTAGYTFIYNNI